MDRVQVSLEGYKSKPSVVVVYTGESKGKTSASIGLACRALGNGWRVAFIQFVKYWEVGEHRFFGEVAPVFGDRLTFYKLSHLNAAEASEQDRTTMAQETYEFAMRCASSGAYDLVVCDEINNAVHDGLLTELDLADLVTKRHTKTSMCLSGRYFPEELLPSVDIATNMVKIKHHFDDMFIANQGIDY